MTARLQVTVSGQVQGVGFRVWVRRQAERLALTGSATNRPDGRVEVIAQGPRAACNSLLEALNGDHTPGYVESIAVDWVDPLDDLDGFVTR